MCRQLWSHNKWREALIAFKTFMCQKTHLHNGGLLFCMEKWLCSNWMINHIPALTIFWEHDLIEGSPLAVLLCPTRAVESLRSRGIRPSAPLKVLLTVGFAVLPSGTNLLRCPTPWESIPQRAPSSRREQRRVLSQAEMAVYAQKQKNW